MEVDDSVEVAPKENPMELESEEGELSDDDGEIQADVLEDASLSDPQKKPEIPGIRVFCPLESDMKIQNRAGGFITGIDVFGKEEQARLVERAKRFGLDTSQSDAVTEHSLKKLYRSVGVKEGDDKEFKFDSLQMHGTEAMSTQDVFEYFKDYAPTSIEWINDESCNVVWLDNLSAIRALLGISKPIKNLKKLREQETNKETSPSKIKKEKIEDNKSGEDSDVIMIEDEAETAAKQAAKLLDEELASDPEAIDALELNMHIPPGQWRKGDTHPNSDGILLRFCPRHSRSREDGPRRLPQPVFGMVGLLSKSRKQRIKEGLLVRPKMFPDDMGDERDFVISSDEEDGRNPWGTLAKSWGNIDRSRRPPPVDDDFFGPPLPPGLPPMPRLPPAMPLPPHSILNRIGVRPPPEKLSSQGRFSRKRSKSPSRSPPLSPVVLKAKSSVHARLHGKRRRRDEDDSDDSAFSGSESDNESWSRKSKIPRMRMYADEEEVKVKERTKLQARRRMASQTHSDIEKKVDLRDRLGREGARHGGSSRTENSHSERWRSDYSDRVVRSERVKSHSRPKPTVKSVASSVWSRLSTDKRTRIKQERESSESDSEHSDTSSSSQENLQITRTLRNKESEESESSLSESDSGSEEYSSSEQESETSRPRGDLRSRLGLKQASTKGRSRSSRSSKSANNTPKQRSPLRIEIDNDEYYRSQKDKD